MINKISATIITHNEESNIERCLKSLDWVDEIVVVDSFSNDSTVDICKKYNCSIIQTEWKGFGNTKKFAVDNANHDWILSIDADEEVPESLKNKIKEILNNPGHQGYKIKRHSFYLGKKINHCGWNNDYPVRLFNRNDANFNDKEIHESVVVRGIKLRIEEPFLHYTYPTISSHINKINRYSDIALTQDNSPKQSSILAAILLGFNKFIKMYFLQLGFLDGKVGFLLCINSSFGVYLKYVKRWHPTN